MSAIAKVIDEIIGAGLAKTLKQEGFRKKSRTYWRDSASCTRVVNVQASSSNIGGTGEFTLNLGVYFPAIAKRTGSIAKGEFPHEYNCAVRKRIGELMPGGSDFWWRIGPVSDVSAISKEVVSAWSSYGKPWASLPWDDLEKARDLLAENHCYHEAIIASLLLKETGRAKALVDEAVAWFRANDNENAAGWMERKGQELLDREDV